jgi:zinc transporter ZupT
MMLGMAMSLIGALIYVRRTNRWEGKALAVTSGLLLLSGLKYLVTTYAVLEYPEKDSTSILAVLYTIEFLLFALFGLFLLLILLRKSKA